MSRADGSEDMAGRWMTFEELAADRGISEASARRLARRHKGWRRRRNNEGDILLFVPQSILDTKEDVRRVPQNIPADIPRVMTVLEAAIASLTSRAERAEARAEQAEAAQARAEARADNADQRADAAQAEAAAAEAEATRLRAEAARRQLSRWAKVLAWLRGE